MDLRLCTLLLVVVLLVPISAKASTKVYIVYMGEKKHKDPAMVTASHHDVLASVLGRYHRHHLYVVSYQFHYSTSL
ncbi:hypothetical protein PR202_gb13098 [Eleusine coracana subsp. coracana]|uniref:Uncharacterized protein n=1 Tax=Eleusine coracana subsp. coracana TaxID=191504 RepID=A0AAV5ESX4_ELECO|nr:hypothetical protein PR202_gb13098 [Eleusine coracana subsp. coracana]